MGRIRRAFTNLQDGFSYARNLAKGNHFCGDLSWTRTGSPPVILCHGFMGTRGTMLPLTKRFQADGRAVFSYHHGTFQLQSMRGSAAELDEHLCRLQESLGVEQFDMVGFSMGGLVALHAVKFLRAGSAVRRLALLGTPVDGTWAGMAGVATIGALSQSVWQVLPPSRFLRDLREAPLPSGLRVRQIHATHDAFCPSTRPLAGVAPQDYVILPGGHSSLVVASDFYLAVRDFLDAESRSDEGSNAVSVGKAVEFAAE